jgi:hypothetical protein
MIHNMIVGGKGGFGNAGLNFAVVRYASESVLPATAEENTIAVFTNTEIASWVFASTKPTEPINGMVWFYTASSSTREFNALDENTLCVYPVYATQYINNEWVPVSIQIYQNGWKAFELPMYKDSVFNTDIFGKVTHNGAIRADGSILFYRYGELSHANYIDATPYSTFQYDIVVSNHGRPEVYVKNQAGTTLATTGQKIGVQTVTLDVSDINEPIRVFFYVYGNADSDNTYINNLKFLP